MSEEMAGAGAEAGGGEGISFGANYIPDPGFELTGPQIDLPTPLPMSEQALPTTEYSTFGALRNGVHAYQYAEMYDRTQTNPTPTAEELQMGVYTQAIEPQVRGAVHTMWERGYPTWSSGFMGSDSSVQAVEGFFNLSTETSDALADIGVTASPFMLSFMPESPDLPTITDRWNAVANALPVNPNPQQVPGRILSNDFSPASHFRGWLDYGLGISIRPDLVAEITDRAAPRS